MKNPLRAAIERIGQSDPLLLSHHPSCKYYSHHTFELYGVELCMGCFIVYPVGFVSLLTLVATRLLHPDLFTIETIGLYIAGSVLIAPMIAGKLLPRQRSSRTRIISKALLAVGLSFLALPVLFRPADRLVTFVLFAGFLVLYVVHKGLTALDDCQGCPEADDFPNCSGMEFEGVEVQSDKE
jgi:hypothetical protein